VTRALVLGTRGSKLAMTQSAAVASALEAVAPVSVSLLEIRTEGDRSQAAIETLGGTGVFVTALRERLLAGDIALAVHSLKDLPTEPAAGLVIAAIPAREDPRDALVARDRLTLNELPGGARIGTGSPRRTAQLRALGLGFEVVPVRGNVDTRLGKVSSGQLDAVVLARAGLARLGRLEDITEVLDPLTMLPAPGQGALAIECRSDDPELAALLALLDDSATRAAVLAERTLLAELEAGCTAPVGAYAEVAEGDHGLEIYLRGVVVSLDGSTDLRLSATGPFDDAEAVGRRLAADLLDAGAADLMGRES
jgi:hydroxymethylbilane synthase